MYRAIAKMPDRIAKRDHCLDWTIQNVYNIVIHLLSAAQQEGLNCQKWSDAVSKASELAEHIRTSPRTYEFRQDFDMNDGGEHRQMLAAELKEYTVVDAMTGQPLRPASMPVVGANGRIGVKLCVIFPALYRTSPEINKEIKLVNATILVKFDHIIPEGGKRKAPRNPRSDEAVTGNLDHGKSFV